MRNIVVPDCQRTVMRREQLENAIKQFIPEPSVPLITTWIQENNVHLHISHKRASKLGDYRAPQRGTTHRISVNHDLNPYDFLITLVHEFAHLGTWMKHKHAVSAHGEEWKQEYKERMQPFMQLTIFPDDIKVALRKHFINPSASCSDLHLQRVLNRYNRGTSQEITTVERIPEGGFFRLRNDGVFRKGPLQRTRYVCYEVQSKKVYYVNALAECKRVEFT
jgi:SprT protein